MTVKTEFEVTEKAGTFVAGRRSPGKGGKISLTEDEAHFALAAGELKRPGTAAGKKPKGKESPPAGDPSGGEAQGETEPVVENPPVVTE